MSPDEEWRLQEAATATVRAGATWTAGGDGARYARIAEAAAVPLRAELPDDFAAGVAELAARERDADADARREARRLCRWGFLFASVLGLTAIALEAVPLHSLRALFDPWAMLALGALVSSEAVARWAVRRRGVDRSAETAASA